MNNVIYFSVNNWFCGQDYPPLDCFRKWLGNDLNQAFRNDEWTRANKLCVYRTAIDMSQNYTVSAPREWVEKNCPELLTDGEYTYITRVSDWENSKDGNIAWKDVEHKKKYSDFVYEPEEDGFPPENGDRFGIPFREYNEENFGTEYYEQDWDYDDEEENDEEENDD